MMVSAIIMKITTVVTTIVAAVATDHVITMVPVRVMRRLLGVVIVTRARHHVLVISTVLMALHHVITVSVHQDVSTMIPQDVQLVVTMVEVRFQPQGVVPTTALTPVMDHTTVTMTPVVPVVTLMKADVQQDVTQEELTTPIVDQDGPIVRILTAVLRMG